MTPTFRSLEMKYLGLAFLGLAWGKNKLHGYATPNTVAKTDVEGQLAYLLDIFASLRRFMPAQFDFRGKDVLELSPGGSRGIGALCLAMGARSYHAIDAFDLAGAEDPAIYQLLIDRVAGATKADRNRAREITFASGRPEFGYAVGRDFDIARLAPGRTFDLIISCAAFEHYDSISDAVAGLSQVARPGCETVHIVDLQTHSRWIRERDPNNIYRYPELLYRLFRFPGQPNRKRPADYLQAFQARGWRDVRFTPSRVIDPELRDVSLQGLAPPFAGREDMVVLDGALTARYPGSASSADRRELP